MREGLGRAVNSEIAPMPRSELAYTQRRARAATSHDHSHLEAAKLFVQHAGALIDVALALRREQRAAVTDALTGLLNRRGFDERLREELERADTPSSPSRS
jgi:GGDEF domain-containing protein